MATKLGEGRALAAWSRARKIGAYVNAVRTRRACEAAVAADLGIAEGDPATRRAKAAEGTALSWRRVRRPELLVKLDNGCNVAIRHYPRRTLVLRASSTNREAR
jgi:hypothetical protein